MGYCHIYDCVQDEGLLQMYQLELHPELYIAAQIFWETIFGPMFLFGRFGNTDITEKDKAMTKLITDYYLGEQGSANINPEHFQNMTGQFSERAGCSCTLKSGIMINKNLICFSIMASYRALCY